MAGSFACGKQERSAMTSFSGCPPSLCMCVRTHTLLIALSFLFSQDSNYVASHHIPNTNSDPLMCTFDSIPYFPVGCSPKCSAGSMQDEMLSLLSALQKQAPRSSAGTTLPKVYGYWVSHINYSWVRDPMLPVCFRNLYGSCYYCFWAPHNHLMYGSSQHPVK